MLIKKITIKNFQSYYGEQPIAFSKGLNLIIGHGGKGKSKLFNAFYWVLFGKIYITDEGWSLTDDLPQSSHGAMQKYEFINKRALFEARQGGKVFTVVKLELMDDKGYDYAIERSVTTTRTNFPEWDSDDAWEVHDNILRVTFENEEGDNVKMNYQANDIIRRLFPEDISNYIWFQGESLESLINFRNPKTLEKAVSHISYFPYYEKMCKIIEGASSKIERMERSQINSLNKFNSAVREKTRRQEELQDTITAELKRKADLVSKKELISQSLAADDIKLQGLASYTELVAKYGTCQRELIGIENSISMNINKIRSNLPTLWILRGIAPMIEKADQLLHSYVQESFSTPTQKFIEDPGRKKLEEILRDGICFVCGSSVKEGTAAHEHIVNRLQEQADFYKKQEEYINNIESAKQFTLLIGRIQDGPEKLLRQLSTIDDSYTETDNSLNDFYALRAAKKLEKNQFDEQIQQIRAKFGVDPVKQATTASNLSSSISNSRTDLEKISRDIISCEQLIDRSIREKNAITTELENMGANDKNGATIAETKWKNMSIFLSDICSRVKDNARIELLHKIEKRANEFYSKFTEHDNGYQGKVIINDDYSIEYDSGLNTSHNDRRKMSIINALLSLNQESMGIYYPFISDAPTSSFDIETTHKYLLGVKDIFNQCIIMTKDVEVDSPAYNDLLQQTNIAKVYVLESEITCEPDKKPLRHEVSTIVTPKN